MTPPQMNRPSYNKYLLLVLTVILGFNCVDRLALGLALQDIKLDLHLSDTQLGFLSGLAFALFYALMGIPIARWADRGNRVTIIAVTTALWSAAVALSGIATNFVQLLSIRVGVAIGEAGCIPPANSLIADSFARAERPRAVARYMLGAPFSAVVGYFVAGWLNQLYGWRTMFLLLGLPGIGLAAVAWFTLREPRLERSTQLSTPAPTESSSQPGIKEVCTRLWANRTFRHLLFCYSVTSFFAFGLSNWQPAYFIRSYKLTTGELGLWFALIYGLGGTLGTYVGGELASRWAAHNESLQLKATALMYCGFAVTSAFIYLSPNMYLAFGLLAVAALGINAATGPLLATIQTLVPARMRAMSIAIVYMFANLIGMGFGPLLAGVLSDALKPFFGAESLRYSLLLMCPGYFWGAWHLWRSSSTVSRDLNAAQALDGEAPIFRAALGVNSPRS